MLGDLQRRKAHHFFALIDEDDNGFIDADDFEAHADRLAEIRDIDKSSAAYEEFRSHVMNWWRHLCTTADVDDNDRVSLEEWENFWDALQPPEEEQTDSPPRNLEQSARQTFSAIDADGDERITEEEFTNWLEAWGAEGADVAFDRLDRDDDGVLTEADIVQAVTEFYLSNDPESPGNSLYGPLSEYPK